MNPPDVSAPVAKPAPGSIASVLARPKFTLLVIGQTVAQLGDRLHNMALIALVAAAAAAATTGVEVSKIGVVTLLPTLLAPIVGALVDRWNKQFTMIACHLMRAIIVVFIPWLYHSLGYIWPVYVVAFFVGVFGVFFNAAKMSVIPDLVTEEELLPANAALTSIGRVATVTGMVGGGLLVGWNIWHRIGWEGWEAGFYIDSLAYLLSVLTLVGISLLSHAAAKRNEVHHPIAESAEVVRREVQHLTSDMRTTFKLIKSHHGLRFVFLMVVVLGGLAGAIFNIMTAASIAVLGAGARGVGFLGGILAGGMIVGSLLVGTVGSRWDKRWMMVIGCLLMGMLMLGGSIWFSYAIFLPIAFVGGAVLAPVMVSMDTLLHEWAPRTSRGLVFSTRDTVLGAAFIGFNTMVGTGIALLQAVARTPYAVAMFVSGLLVITGTLLAASTQVGLRRAGHP
ncbi:MAG TPA: MFS transporter [Gemmatimonadaceae bacterium]|nr:MFS transporter [Gemmatimonadaceae bacterium]